jgi:hypothetical protein
MAEWVALEPTPTGPSNLDCVAPILNAQKRTSLGGHNAGILISGIERHALSWITAHDMRADARAFGVGRSQPMDSRQPSFLGLYLLRMMIQPGALPGRLQRHARPDSY